jgi:hypothetical protein
MTIDEAAHAGLPPVSSERLRRIESCFARIRKKRNVGQATEEMIETIEEQFSQDARGSGFEKKETKTTK